MTTSNILETKESIHLKQRHIASYLRKDNIHAALINSGILLPPPPSWHNNYAKFYQIKLVGHFVTGKRFFFSALIAFNDIPIYVKGHMFQRGKGSTMDS